MQEPLKIATRHYYWKLSTAYCDALQLKAYRDFVQFPDDGVLLDLGCSDGTFATMLKEVLNLKQPFVGVDIDEAALRQASKRSAVYTETRNVDASNLTFDEGTFAGAFANMILHCLPEPKKAVSEVGRTLRKGGVFACTVATKRAKQNFYLAEILHELGLNRWQARYMEAAIHRFQLYSLFSVEVWEELIEGGGLNVESVIPLMSSNEQREWSMFTLAPFRLLGLLRILPSQTMRLMASSLMREYMAESYDQWVDQAKLNEAAYVLIIARKG